MIPVYKGDLCLGKKSNFNKQVKIIRKIMKNTSFFTPNHNPKNSYFSCTVKIGLVHRGPEAERLRLINLPMPCNPRVTCMPTECTTHDLK